jgi:DNA ligase-1
MQKELRILLEIENSTGNGSQKIKQDLIKNNYSKELEYLLKVALDPFLTTKLHKLPVLEESPYIIEDGDLFERFKDLTEKLFFAPAANDKLREEAFEVVNCYPLSIDERKILSKVLTKRLNIGIGAKLINKAFNKEVIPDPSLMLAQDDEDEIKKWDLIVCEEKYDGVRVIAFISGGEVKFYTRAFNEIPNQYLKKIADECLILIKNSGLKGEWFFDGELTDLNRKSVSGKVTQMLKGKPLDSIGDDLLYNVFDLEDADTLKSGKGIIPFDVRRSTLEGVFSTYKTTSLTLADSFLTTEKEDIYAYYNKIVARGGEGVILKNPEHVYECKRSKNWIKLKEVNDCDLIITGWYPGEGKREGFIGGFYCEDSSGTVKVKVGAGFTDQDLKDLSENPDSQIGKVCAIQYNVIINDKNDNWSLFLPRFIEIRNDKDLGDNMSGLCK